MNNQANATDDFNTRVEKELTTLYIYQKNDANKL